MKPKVGRNFTSERGEGVKGEVKNISLHWLQGIFETVPKGIGPFLTNREPQGSAARWGYLSVVINWIIHQGALHAAPCDILPAVGLQYGFLPECRVQRTRHRPRGVCKIPRAVGVLRSERR